MKILASAGYLLVALLVCSCSGRSNAEDLPSLALPDVGSHEVLVLTPTILELTLISTKAPDPAPVNVWDFVNGDGKAHLPEPESFQVVADGKAYDVVGVGFKRRVVYAPLKKRDLRIGNHIYLKLSRPLKDGQLVEIKNPDGKLWQAESIWSARADPARWSPVIHVNQTGYGPGDPKKASLGFYLGSLGELNLADELKTGSGSIRFSIVEQRTGKKSFEGTLAPRAETGWNFSCYEKVFEADFSKFQKAGEYCLAVDGLGRSFPFNIDPGISACFARTYALGLYHQRCGGADELPFTRFTHEPCHTAPAEVPTLEFTNAQFFLAQSTSDWTNTPKHIAPRLENTERSLYPFKRTGKVDVSGGHHDAGDYSKYTINSAGLVHFLMFAADNFPGVGALDNLGLPESGDGQSDVLQEAKWEADFLAKMQDLDGGFYFLVYPRNRRYENNVPPDKGDKQIVWPKNTAATAAATAALAQCAASPLFKKQFPEAATQYLEKAKKGWSFLEKAIEQHGKDGAYQKMTHYGNQFGHEDEMTWAACELYLATGESKFHAHLKTTLNPAKTRKWGWWRLYEAYGCAVRSYAFGARSGRVKASDLDFRLVRLCEDEVIAAADDQLRRSRESAYGISFPSETKRTRSAGWFFPGDSEFDLAAAMQFEFPSLKDPRPDYLEAILANRNYEAGCNPVNVSYITGLGWKRPHEIVHQWSQNSERKLPPDGITIGNIQSGFGWLDHYKRELGALSYPPDGGGNELYPFYDRWGDSFNLSTEFVVLNEGRALGVNAMLMARTPAKEQSWASATGTIIPESGNATNHTVRLRLECKDVKLDAAQIVWEAAGREPAFGNQIILPSSSADKWVEAEACLPDGRRVFGVLKAHK
ncbi:MAG TPA: glycoside hydrolase family 9 protein [Candidatus Saccharimonadales bacterium]|nr:glycoside hydrolase family 9 protein [Candidatus Saccharimonadales bacterium]